MKDHKYGPKNIDWTALETEYRAGVKSDVALAKQFGISRTAIQKRAKAAKWGRDLSARIKAKAAEKVARARVAGSVAQQSAATENQVVAANAEAIKDVVLSHQKVGARIRGNVEQMLAELTGQNVSAQALEDFAELAAEVRAGMRTIDGDEAEGKVTIEQRARFNAAYKTFTGAVSLGNRAQIVQRLAQAATSVVAIDCQSFGINERSTESDAVRALKELNGLA